MYNNQIFHMFSMQMSLKMYNQIIKPFPHTDSFWRLYSRRFLKTLWQKWKLLMMSNFPFCHFQSNIFFLYPSVCFESHLLQICCMWERVKLMYVLIINTSLQTLNSNLFFIRWDIQFQSMSFPLTKSTIVINVIFRRRMSNLVSCESWIVACNIRIYHTC